MSVMRFLRTLVCGEKIRSLKSQTANLCVRCNRILDPFHNGIAGGNYKVRSKIEVIYTS